LGRSTCARIFTVSLPLLLPIYLSRNQLASKVLPLETIKFLVVIDNVLVFEGPGTSSVHKLLVGQLDPVHRPVVPFVMRNLKHCRAKPFVHESVMRDLCGQQTFNEHSFLVKTPHYFSNEPRLHRIDRSEVRLRCEPHELAVSAETIVHNTRDSVRAFTFG